MNSKYTGKLVEDLLDKMSIIESGEVGGVISGKIFEKFLRKDQDDRTEHTLASDKLIEVGNFVSGTSGAIIYVDKATGHTVAELDKLYVRMKAYFELLEIINVNSVGGKLIVSPAGGIKCSLVETYDSWGYYRCYFLSEQDGEKIENRFAVGDLAYSKTFNAREGSYNKISNRYYWRLVVGRGENYIDLSKTDCDADSDEPQEGDVIVHRGNRNDVDRLNCLEFSSVDSFSPSITLYQGINDYSLSDKNVIQFGVEKSTGKAFMNVYGDMFIGNRDNSSYIRYSPEKGVEIKGKLDIGTSFGDKTLLDAIDLASTAYEEDLNNLKDIVNRDILNILNLLDGAIETWFYDPAPTLTNLPASLWTTESDRNIHLGDLYYSGAGRAYRFQYDADNSLYYWQEIVDTDIVLALENAKKAQDTADSKRKIFVRKPENSDSYDIGDMWVNANYIDNSVTYKDDLLRAIVTKNAGELFKIEHWTLASKYTDDTVAKDALEKATNAQLTVNTLLSDVTSFKGYVDGAFLDGVIDSSEALAIEKYINQLNTIKQQVDKSYEEIIKNSILENTTYLTNLNDSYSAFSTSYNELIDTINAAISDNKTTDLEKSAVDSKYSTFNDKYRDYTAYLNLAINYIEETINGKVERALLDIGGYKYLKAALLENTSIEGGLIQSSMLSLGYTKNNLFLVMAGTNGLVLDKGDRTIASWFGGGMIDMFDYYDSNTKTFNVPEDVRAAAGLDRMDGTGYRAKGNLWWDADGVVHADPLSFFVGEATVGGLLASFLVVMKEDGKHPLYLIPQVPFLSLEIADYIRIGDALLKYDSTSKAIYVTSADGTTSMGFYASGYVSALGKNSSGGSTGSASALYQLTDVIPNSTNDGVLNAANGSVLMYNGSKWQAGNIVTDISPLTLNVNGSNLFTYNGKSSITANLTVPTKLSQLTDDVVSGKYLPLSGGTISNSSTQLPLSISANGMGNYCAIQFKNGSVKLGSLGVSAQNVPSFLNSSGTWFNLLHSGNISAYNAGSATKLQTARTIWGQSFDGTNNVSGTIYLLNHGEHIKVSSSTGWAMLNILTTGWSSEIGDYTRIQVPGGSYNSSAITLTSKSLMGVCVSSPQYTLHVGGTIYGNSTATFASTVTAPTFKGSLDGNASTASKWQTARTLTLTGSVAGSVSIDGSGNVSLATTTNHTHSYLPLSGGTMTGDIVMGTSHYIYGKQESSGAMLYFDGTKTIVGSVGASTSAATAIRTKTGHVTCGTTYGTEYTILDSNNYNSYSPTLTGTGASGTWGINISGNAATASKLLTITVSPFNSTPAKYRKFASIRITGRYSGKQALILLNVSNSTISNGNSCKVYIMSYQQDALGNPPAYRIETDCDDRHMSIYGVLNYNSSSSTIDMYVYGKNRPYYSINVSQLSGTDVINIGSKELDNLPSGTIITPTKYGSVYSATKLQTARTIWGQSFDGTGNVSGIIYANSHIFMNSGGEGIYITRDGISLHDGNNAWVASILSINSSGDIIIHHNASVNGNIAATGAVTAKASSSDIRLKTNITDYKALSIIRNHRSVKYHWNEAAKANADIFNDNDWHFGLIAQEMQQDLPQMVSDVFKDYLVINYERLIPICWKGLQEVDDEVTRLKKKVRKLEMEIRELKQERA